MMTSALARGAVTLLLGCLGGLSFFALNLPLPWVLGSLTATALCSLLTPFRPGLPASWRSIALVAIGTMLGTGFTPDVLSRAGSWAVSVIFMLVLSVGFCLFGYWVFRRWGRMDRITALFAAMPGGLTVVTVLAEQYRADVKAVAMCHIARIMVLLISAPIMIQAISGIDLADANQAAYRSTEQLDLVKHGMLALVAAICFMLARRVRFPSAMLLIPLLASAALHALGLITVHVPPAPSNLAQVAIGASVGARFAGYGLGQILRDGWLAALVAAVLALGSLLAAMLMAPLVGADVAPLYIAYLPGGAPELGVVALALMIEPAMVAAHHVSRVFLIVATLPLAARKVAGRSEDEG